MLAYLDALIAALAARSTTEIDRLLTHPLARILSPDALADASAERWAAESGAPAGTPLRLLQLRYRTAQLLGQRAGSDALPPEATESRRTGPPPAAWNERRPSARNQMELPLSA
jgi:hypothetical protein